MIGGVIDNINMHNKNQIPVTFDYSDLHIDNPAEKSALPGRDQV